jgi:hypothetical protein
MFGQVQRSIERHRHSTRSWLDRAILSNGEIPSRAINPHPKLAAGAPDLGQPICLRLHSSKNRAPALVEGCNLHGNLE